MTTVVRETDLAAFVRGRIAPAECRHVVDEAMDIPFGRPVGFSHGAALGEVRTVWRGARWTTVPRALDPASLRVVGVDRELVLGRDVEVDPVWATLASPNAHLGGVTAARVSYDYSLMRLDGLVRTSGGDLELRRGESHLAAPRPPVLSAGEVLVATVLVPPHSDGSEFDIYSVLDDRPAPTRSTAGLLPRSVEALAAGRPLRVVSWGDSVSVGGDATTDAEAFPVATAGRIQNAFPAAAVGQQTVAIGGTRSLQWLDAVNEDCSWERVIDARPDVLTLEFVNDQAFDTAQLATIYDDILRRVADLGAELVIVTPHPILPEWMGYTDQRDSDKRPLVAFLRQLATERGIALADVAWRWENLWRLGLPYMTLQWNGINHPDDRGHALFADEIGVCFGITRDCDR